MSSMDDARKRCSAPDETDSAVEKQLLKKNGVRTTMVDLKELLIAVNHDSRARDLWICQLLEDHSEVQYHVTKPEFDAIIARFSAKHDKRDQQVEVIEKEVDDIWLAVREEDPEIGDVRRAWRVARWFVAAGVILGLDIFARYLAETITQVP